ncbi:hypothetical protein F5Y19DRAFT_492961 [Xylariaceae sp. FL1651]|nr:hypothetical protein F5Y19DRAFT_492961 [Xylariaceae sp. FL1651]
MRFNNLPLYVVLTALLPTTLACIHHSQRVVSAREIQAQAARRQAPPPSTKTIIENVRVFDGECFTGPQSVVFANGYITSDMKDIQTRVDGTGQFLIPGLIDAHVHANDLAALDSLASYGVTTALNMVCRGDYAACNALRNNNQTGVASLLSASIGAVGANSSNGALQPPPDQLVYPDTDVAQLVRWAFGNSSDYFKMVAKPASLTQAQQDAIASTAHALGKQTMTHASDLASYEQAVASGSDGIQHIPDDGLLSDATVAAMKEAAAPGQFATPTMYIFKYGYENPLVYAFLGRTNSTNATYANVEANVRRLRAAGVPLLAGTDAVGAIAPGIDVPFGLSLHWELELLAGVGLTPLEALRAGTVESARWHRLFDRGEVKVGRRADLVLLNSNPLLNISNTQDIARVWAGGVEVQNVAKPT